MATDINQISQELAQDMEMLRNSVQRNSVSLNQLDDIGKSSSQSLKKFRDQLVDTSSTFVKSVYDGSSALQTMAATTGSVSQGFQEIVKSIPVLGGALAGLAKRIFGVTEEALKTTDVLFKAYSDISRAGLTGAEGLSKFIEQAQKFGFGKDNIDRFVSAMGTGAESFAQFSGGIQNGVNAIANVAQDIKDSGLRGELIAMGMNIPEITTGLMRYTRIMSMTGQQNRMDQIALRKGAESYIKQLDLLSKLTGKQADQIQREREAREADERIMIRRMESQQEEERLRAISKDESIAQADRDRAAAQADRIAADRERERELIDLIPENMQREFGAMFAGLITSPQMASMMQAMPETTRYIQSGGRDIVEFSKLVNKELKVFTDPSGGIGASAARVNQLLQTYGVELKDVVRLQNLTAAIANGSTVADAKAAQEIRDQNTKNIARSEDLNAIAKESLQKLLTEGVQPLITGFTALNEQILDLGETLGVVKVIPPYPFNGTQPQAPVSPAPPPITGADVNQRRAQAGQPPLSVEAAEAQAARESVEREMRRRNRARRQGQQSAPGGPAPGGPAPGGPAPGRPAPGGPAPGRPAPGGPAPSPEPEAVNRNLFDLFSFGPRTGSVANFLQLQNNFREQLIAAAEDYKKITGNSNAKLDINSAFRTREDQQRLYDSGTIGPDGKRYIDGRPVAPPGGSDHERGVAVDIQQGQTGDRAAINALNKAGLFQRVQGDDVHFTARYGRMTSGPLSGYRATLHGNEVVIPLSNGTTIPLDMTPLIRNMDQNAQILSAQIERLDDLITLSRDSLNVNRKMLSYRS